MIMGVILIGFIAIVLIIVLTNKRQTTETFEAVALENSNLLKKLNDVNTPPPLLAYKMAEFYTKQNTGAKLTPMWGSYVPAAPPGKWVSTMPEFLAPLLPEWGSQPPYVDSTKTVMYDMLPELDSHEYAKEFASVKDIGSATSSTRTSRETLEAHAWDLGSGTVTPPGKWNEIATKYARDGKLTGSQLRDLYRILNVAMSDAGIAAWRSKYGLNLWRPVTAIREAADDGNQETVPDTNWVPLLVSPPFPSCVSGHSSFSAAAGTILAAKVPGKHTISLVYDGETLSYPDITDAVTGAGHSRITGGIHFPIDNTMGLRVGREVGELVLKNFEMQELRK